MDKIDLPTDPVKVVIQGWRRLAIGLALGLVGAVLYATFAPKWYQSRLSILPLSQPKSPLLNAAASGGGAAAAIPLDLAADLLGGSNESERIVAVLSSSSVSDAVIEKFDLLRRYDEEHMEFARKALWEHCATKTERKSGLVTLICEDRDPKVAQAMLQYFAEVGNRVFRRVSKSSASEERQFLEERVAQTRKDVDDASRKLRAYQEGHRVVDLIEQAKAVILGMARLETDVVAKEVQLGYLQKYSSPDEVTVRQLRDQIAVTRAKLKSLEEEGAKAGERPAPASASEDVFPPAMSLPRMRYELEGILRDQKIQEAVFTALTQRFELAKVNEARDTSTFQVLDSPDLPTIRARPKRLPVLAVGAALGLVAGLAWILLPVHLPRRVSR